MSSRPPGRWVRGRSIESGVRISTCALAISSASVRSPSRRPASWLSRAALFSARSFSRSMNILSSMPLARQARPALSRRAFFSRAFCSARSVLRRASEARSRSSAARARAASRASAKAGHAPPNMLMPIGVSSTMRSTRSSSARSWLATRTPPCQRSSNCATACRPSVSRLLVGSSSSSRSGASIRRRASARRVRSPPLKETIGRCSGNDGSPASASAACILASSVQSASVASSSDP